MTSAQEIHRPVLAPHARFRWDEIRRQHQIVFPEGVLVLNESAVAIMQLCVGRPMTDLLSELKERVSDGNPTADVHEFLERLAKKGLLSDAADS